MPKFTVHLTQMVEQIARLEIEADDAEDAIKKALDTDPGVSADWREGDHAKDVEAYSVATVDGTIVWER